MKRLNILLAWLMVLMLAFGYAVPGAYAYGKANLGISSATVRTAAILTTVYVASTRKDIEDFNQLNLLCSFTVGSSTGVKIKIEVSDDDSTYYQTQAASVGATGLVTLTPAEYTKDSTANFVISIPTAYKYYRVSAKALTSATGTSLSIVQSTGIL